MTVESQLNLSPEDIERLANDDKTFRVWVITELVKIDDRVSKLEHRWRLIEALLITVIGSLVTLVGVLFR